ncbi:MAG TPA: sigma-54 dependent transcriptional regulator [Bacteroidales bacterium]|nr:sigma-54 dependent transcriptional regulator [Bacteroidales bacterium]HRZ48425.1 sigma-54 dependent transcriptional regulator [Bacteroidales bacterium]
MDVQSVKQRFGIIGHSAGLNRALETAIQVAPTDITVLITGESGVGKENFPRIIHHLSARKHGPYIAVNCGAIPEGTIDSELFGHEKGSFTGAHEARKGYFEVVNGGTIFLDEVAELPLSTQVRLLRVLESGEFMRVGSSKVIRTNVRVVAATNVNMPEAISHGKFREDLYYRLNTVPVYVPPLRDRKEDIILLFRKFSVDFSERYRVPELTLDEGAQELLMRYRWPGNIRQLKNITEQLSILERNRHISQQVLQQYLPDSQTSQLPVLFRGGGPGSADAVNERDLLYKVLFDMKKDVHELKSLVMHLMSDPVVMQRLEQSDPGLLKRFGQEPAEGVVIPFHGDTPAYHVAEDAFGEEDPFDEESEIIEESLSIEKREIELIRKALRRHQGKRKAAAAELGISERTLYRKINEYNIKE